MITASTVQLLKHPGPIAPTRRDVMAGQNQKTYRVVLRKGDTLYASITRALKVLKIRSAALDIKHVGFSRLSYYLITSSPDVEQVAHYTTPLTLSESATLVGSGVTIGVNQEGEYAIHCHGLTVTESGRLVGGHFLTDACVIGQDGIAYINELNHMDLTIGIDPEIKTPVFQPSYSEATHE